jgi:hypothetical protein
LGLGLRDSTPVGKVERGNTALDGESRKPVVKTVTNAKMGIDYGSVLL